MKKGREEPVPETRGNNMPLRKGRSGSPITQRHPRPQHAAPPTPASLPHELPVPGWPQMWGCFALPRAEDEDLGALREGRNGAAREALCRGTTEKSSGSGEEVPGGTSSPSHQQSPRKHRMGSRAKPRKVRRTTFWKGRGNSSPCEQRTGTTGQEDPAVWAPQTENAPSGITGMVWAGVGAPRHRHRPSLPFLPPLRGPGRRRASPRAVPTESTWSWPLGCEQRAPRSLADGGARPTNFLPRASARTKPPPRPLPQRRPAPPPPARLPRMVLATPRSAQSWSWEPGNRTTKIPSQHRRRRQPPRLCSVGKTIPPRRLRGARLRGLPAAGRASRPPALRGALRGSAGPRLAGDRQGRGKELSYVKNKGKHTNTHRQEKEEEEKRGGLQGWRSMCAFTWHPRPSAAPRCGFPPRSDRDWTQSGRKTQGGRGRAAYSGGRAAPPARPRPLSAPPPIAARPAPRPRAAQRRRLQPLPGPGHAGGSAPRRPAPGNFCRCLWVLSGSRGWVRWRRAECCPPELRRKVTAQEVPSCLNVIVCWEGGAAGLLWGGKRSPRWDWYTWELLPLSRQERESLVLSCFLMKGRNWTPKPACFPAVGQADSGSGADLFRGQQDFSRVISPLLN